MCFFFSSSAFSLLIWSFFCPLSLIFSIFKLVFTSFYIHIIFFVVILSLSFCSFSFLSSIAFYHYFGSVYIFLKNIAFLMSMGSVLFTFFLFFFFFPSGSFLRYSVHLILSVFSLCPFALSIAIYGGAKYTANT